jgi:CheY-like chemotaxis protein
MKEIKVKAMDLASDYAPIIAPTILIVDDDDDIRYMLSEALRMEGYLVTEASNAAEAEQKALRDVPHLILLDLNMPGTNGMTALWNIRRHQEIAAVPVVIVSAHDAFDLRAEAAAAGCKGYLSKPLEVQELRDVVRSVIEDSE